MAKKASKKTVKKSSKRKAPAPRKPWTGEAARGCLNDDDKIVSFPEFVSGDATPEPGEFHVRRHVIPGKDAFASEETYWKFRANVLDKKAADMLAKASEYRKLGEKIAKLGTPTQRKAAAKLERAMKRAVTMRKEAEAAGIDVAEYMADF